MDQHRRVGHRAHRWIAQAPGPTPWPGPPGPPAQSPTPPAVSSGRGSRTGEGVPPSVNYKLEMRCPLSNRRETTGKTAGKRASNRWKNRWKTTGGPLAKTVGKPPKTAGKGPVFGSLLPVSIRAGNGWEGSLRRHFSAPGGGCHKRPTFQAQLMYFSKRWGWWNGDLRVFRRDEGHSRSDDAKSGISRIAHA